MSEYAIKAEGLVKRYGDVVALNGLDLCVPKGSVLGLLGPNGAGKTTAVRILTTLLSPDEGTVEVAGIDLLARPAEVRQQLGLSGQYAAVDEYLTGHENLEMVGRLYHLGKAASKKRATELLEQFDLSEAANRTAKTYSGGMRRRLDLAAALVAQPPVLFLDEPTTGLDPASRLGLWNVISDLVSGGTSVLLTTQYLEEAERLADNIMVIDKGRAIAEGTAAELKAKLGGERIEFIAANEDDVGAIAQAIAHLGTDDVSVKGNEVSVAVSTGPAALMEALRLIDERNIRLIDVSLRRPTLDDVFLTLTGHATQTEEATEAREKEAVS